MSRELAVLIIVAIAVIILGSMFLGWRRRLRRDSDLEAPLGVPEHTEITGRHDVLYIATTRHDQHLERLAIKPLVYRARGELVLTDRGVALSLDGSPTVFIASSRLVAVDLATVAIDRAVERDGLIRLVWRVADDILVDSFLRPKATGAQQILPELERLSAGTENGEQS